MPKIVILWPLAMGICSVLLGLALGSVQPMIMSMLHQITPEARHGEALGLRLMATKHRHCQHQANAQYRAKNL